MKGHMICRPFSCHSTFINPDSASEIWTWKIIWMTLFLIPSKMVPNLDHPIFLGEVTHYVWALGLDSLKKQWLRNMLEASNTPTRPKHVTAVLAKLSREHAHTHTHPFPKSPFLWALNNASGCITSKILSEGRIHLYSCDTKALFFFSYLRTITGRSASLL